jgi:hypothetical protein
MGAVSRVMLGESQRRAAVRLFLAVRKHGVRLPAPRQAHCDGPAWNCRVREGAPAQAGARRASESGLERRGATIVRK